MTIPTYTAFLDEARSQIERLAESVEESTLAAFEARVTAMSPARSPTRTATMRWRDTWAFRKQRTAEEKAHVDSTPEEHLARAKEHQAAAKKAERDGDDIKSTHHTMMASWHSSQHIKKYDKRGKPMRIEESANGGEKKSVVTPNFSAEQKPQEKPKYGPAVKARLGKGMVRMNHQTSQWERVPENELKEILAPSGSTAKISNNVTAADIDRLAQRKARRALVGHSRRAHELSGRASEEHQDYAGLSHPDKHDHSKLRKLHADAAEAHKNAQAQYAESDFNHHIHKDLARHHSKMAAMFAGVHLKESVDAVGGGSMDKDGMYHFYINGMKHAYNPKTKMIHASGHSGIISKEASYHVGHATNDTQKHLASKFPHVLEEASVPSAAAQRGSRNASDDAHWLSQRINSEHQEQAYDSPDRLTAATLRQRHSDAAAAHGRAQKKYPEAHLNHQIHKLTAAHHAKMAGMLSKYG